MSNHQNDHMTPEEFRRHGRQVVDWIADYYENIESLPALKCGGADFHIFTLSLKFPHIFIWFTLLDSDYLTG